MLALAWVAVACPRQAQAAEPGAWTSLFDGREAKEWRGYRKPVFPAKGWEVREGWLHCLGQEGGDLVSAAEYENFEFEWEWRQASNGNSGVKYFVTETRTSAIGHEYQMIDDAVNPDAKIGAGKRLTASFYDVLMPVSASPRPPGQTNQSRILVQGRHVEHWLNGVRVLQYECGSDSLKEALARSKFKTTPGFGEPVRGRILLQDHHSEVWFRNMRIRPLPAR